MATLNIRTIKSNIDKIEKLDQERHLETQLCKKISILECGGWIEEKMNDIIFCYIEKTIKNNILKEKIKELTKKRRYGFKYLDFKEKLFLILSQAELLRLEQKIDKDKNYKLGLDHFTNILGSLSKERDSLAHTYIKKRGPVVSALSFKNIKDYLDQINTVFKIIKRFMYFKYPSN